MGGFRAQGRTAAAAAHIVKDAVALEAAGACAVVVECVPEAVGRAVTDALEYAPTIGIGAGGGTTGQVLVFHDLLGFANTSLPSSSSAATLEKGDANFEPAYDDYDVEDKDEDEDEDDEDVPPPKFCKQYASVGREVQTALRSFVDEVHSGAFPGETHAPYAMARGELDEFHRLVITGANTAQQEEKTTTPAAQTQTQTQTQPKHTTPPVVTCSSGHQKIAARVPPPLAVEDLLSLQSGGATAEQKIY